VPCVAGKISIPDKPRPEMTGCHPSNPKIGTAKTPSRAIDNTSERGVPFDFLGSAQGNITCVDRPSEQGLLSTGLRIQPKEGLHTSESCQVMLRPTSPWCVFRTHGVKPDILDLKEGWQLRGSGPQVEVVLGPVSKTSTMSGTCKRSLSLKYRTRELYDTFRRPLRTP